MALRLKVRPVVFIALLLCILIIFSTFFVSPATGNGQNKKRGNSPTAIITQPPQGTTSPSMTVKPGSNSSSNNSTVRSIYPILVLETYWIRINKGDPARFNASGSYDPDGNISKFKWDFGDGQTAEGAIVEHTYARTGRFLANVTIIDPTGLSRTGSMTVTVNGLSPVSIPGNMTNTTIGTPITFDGTRSYDTDGTIVKYEWAFGDGGFAEGARVSHVYERADSFKATLRVTDSDGINNTAYMVVKVAEYPAPATIHQESSGTILMSVAFLIIIFLIAPIILMIAFVRARGKRGKQ